MSSEKQKTCNCKNKSTCKCKSKIGLDEWLELIQEFEKEVRDNTAGPEEAVKTIIPR